MRLACSLALLTAACRFDLPEEVEWVVAEELAVPADGTKTTSALVLEAGVRYRLRASGTIRCGFDVFGDAEFYGVQPNGEVMDGTPALDFGLAVNDAIVDGARTPRWGAYDAAHRYEIEWMGDGAPLVAQVHDDSYAYASGTLTLEILALP